MLASPGRQGEKLALFFPKARDGFHAPPLPRNLHRWTTRNTRGTISMHAIFRRQMMAITAHLAGLAEKHRALEGRIDQVVSSPGSDDTEIRRLKQEKLKLKDEMERLIRETWH